MAVTNVDKNNFDKEVLNEKKLVLVDFNANWCGPCQMLKPVIEELANEEKDIKFISINIDDESELAEEYGVSSIPCLVVFNAGKEISRSVGFKSKDDIKELLGVK